MATGLTMGLAGHRGNPGTKGRLLAKSLEAYVLSLETINRLTITYRTETFCALLCNAWELLLKAKIVHDAKKSSVIYYPTKPGERRRSLSLRDCLTRVFDNEHDPVRRNVERIEEIRDAAVHLFIADVPKDVLGLFQAGVINYHDMLNRWFGVSLSERIPVGMMTIVFDRSPETMDLANPLMRRRLGKDAADYLLSLSQALAEEHERTGLSAEFSVEIRYDLVIQKRPEGAGVIAVTGEDGAPARTLEVAKDPSDEYPFRQKDLWRELETRLPDRPPTLGDVQAVIRAERVQAKREWFFQGKVKGMPATYSRRFSDWFVTRWRQDPDWATKCREKAREQRTREREAKA